MMHVRKDSRNRPRPGSRHFRPPRPRIEPLNQQMIDLFVNGKTPHHLAQRISLREDLRPSHRVPRSQMIPRTHNIADHFSHIVILESSFTSYQLPATSYQLLATDH
jgi:hypothetical protein